MPVALAAPLFVLAACVSLCTSWLLVSRLERVGERLGLSEALLGMVAALAADAPEITSAAAAMASGQQRVGIGVVVGSNVFNLAVLLGLGALVAGRIGLHRRVILLGGSVAAWVAAVSLVTLLGVLTAGEGLALAGAVVLGYAALLGLDRRGSHHRATRRRWARWLRAAVAEEERELDAAIRPPRGRARDALIGAVALVVVVAASATMERAATDLGSGLGIPTIVVGALLLAAVTSLPNAVTAVYLAARGRGAAVLSTTLNSNNFNIVVGLLLAGTLTGLGAPSASAMMVVAWYAGLTGVALLLAYRDRGLGRGAGGMILGSYAVFVGSLILVAAGAAPMVWVAPVSAALAGAGVVVLWISQRRRRS